MKNNIKSSDWPASCPTTPCAGLALCGTCYELLVNCASQAEPQSSVNLTVCIGNVFAACPCSELLKVKSWLTDPIIDYCSESASSDEYLACLNQYLTPETCL